MARDNTGNFAAQLLQRLGKASCLIDAATGKNLAGEEVQDAVAGFALGFRSAGLDPGDRIVLGCGINGASALAYLGAIYAGLVPVPVEERLLANSGNLLLATSKANALWTNDGVRVGWAENSNVILVSGMFKPHPHSSVPAATRSEDDLAALMPTSGATGVPRLVMVTHGNLHANTEAIIRSQNLGPDDRAMLIMPVSYCFGASVLHTHLYAGGGVVLDSRFMFPDKVLHAIEQYQCTTFAGVPIVYNVLLRRSNLRSISLPSLRRFLQAGGALEPESIRQIRAIAPKTDFFVMYGQTEATSRISCLPADHLDEKLGSAGIPLDNLEVRIVNEKGIEAAPGETGEVQVKGPSVCRGYLNDPEATGRKFSEAWLKTGDFACRDEDGYLWIKGRSDDFIKIRGVRVSVGEVETRVAAIAGVSECAAMGIKHAEAGEALALLIVPDSRIAPDERIVSHGVVTDAELALAVRRALPPHWTCVSIKIVVELPRTGNGKIARTELPKLL